LEDSEKTKRASDNPGFLKAVICFLAEERFQTEIMESGMDDTVGPGQEFENKDDYLSQTIKSWFDQVSEKIKVFEPVSDIEVTASEVEFANNYYECRLGAYITTEDATELTRIPGGWILKDTRDRCSFVEFSDEFEGMVNYNPEDIIREV